MRTTRPVEALISVTPWPNPLPVSVTQTWVPSDATASGPGPTRMVRTTDAVDAALLMAGEIIITKSAPVRRPLRSAL